MLLLLGWTLFFSTGHGLLTNNIIKVILLFHFRTLFFCVTSLCPFLFSSHRRTKPVEDNLSLHSSTTPMLLSATLATDYNHSFATMIHPNANLSPNYYTHNDPTSQTFDHPEQVFGDHLHVSHDVSPTCTDSVLAHLSPQEQLTHVRHPYNYYHPSLSLPSSEAELHLDQSRIMALGHGRHMSPVDESPCTSCDPQKFSCPSMSVAMPFSAIRREHSAGSLSIGAASLPSDCTMDDLSFHGAHGMTVSFSSLPNSPQVNSLLAQSYEQQPGWRHYQHGQCQGAENKHCHCTKDQEYILNA